MFEDVKHYFSSTLVHAEHMNPYGETLALLVASIVAGLILQLIFVYALRTYARKSKNIIAKSLARHVGPRTMLLFPLFIFYLLQPFANLPNSTYDLVMFKTVQTLVIITFGWVLMKLTRVFEDAASKYYEDDLKNPYKARKVQTQLQYVRRILSGVIFVLVFAVVLLTFDSVRKIGTTLLTSAGVVSIIVGIAAQKSLGNLLAGFQIAFTQPIKIGDSLVVEGEWGTVEEITLTYVVVMIWDKRRMILPITYFIENPFQNWTRSSSELLGVVLLFADYSLPVDALRNELDKILEQEPLWDRQSKALQIVDATDKVMQIRILASAADASAAFDLRCIVREKIIKFIQQEYPGALPKERVSLLEVDSQDGQETKQPAAAEPIVHHSVVPQK